MPYERPKPCLDSTCECIQHCYTKEHFDMGYSFDCIGKMKEVNTIKWHEVTHRNGYAYCIYTPFKGMLRYMINADDAWRMYCMMAKILEDYYHTECCECHETDRAGMNYLTVNGQWYCRLCAMRHGYIKWDGRQYVIHQ